MFVVADIGDSAQRASDEFFAWVPKLVAFVVILLIVWIVARVLAGIVRQALRRVDFDRTLGTSAGGTLVSRVTDSPSHLLSRVVYWLVFLGGLSIAVDVLGIASLENLVASVWAYIPNVLAALLIFLVAGAVAAGIATIVERTMGDTPTGGVVKTVAPILVMAIATFMILDQLKVATNIVVITYAGLIGAVALGMALAFGLGGREVASRLLENAYSKGIEAKEDVKRDVREGVESGKAQAAEIKGRLEDEGAAPA